MDWDTVSTIITFVISLVSPHWSFFASAIILGMLGEVSKNLVLGPKNEKVKRSKFQEIYKKTLTVHPIFVGGIVGYILFRTFDGMLYLALSGAISSAFYKFLKKIYPDVVRGFRTKFSRFMGFHRQSD